MLLTDIVDTSMRVAATSKRLEKLSLLVDLLRRLEPAEVPIAVSYLAGEMRQGRIGVGWAMLRDARPDHAAAEPNRPWHDVDATLARVATVKRAGSNKERGRLLHELRASGTREEQDFLGRLLLGELRQGALEGVMLDAVARAANVPAASVRRAHL